MTMTLTLVLAALRTTYMTMRLRGLHIAQSDICILIQTAARLIPYETNYLPFNGSQLHYPCEGRSRHD